MERACKGVERAVGADCSPFGQTRDSLGAAVGRQASRAITWHLVSCIECVCIYEDGNAMMRARPASLQRTGPWRSGRDRGWGCGRRGCDAPSCRFRASFSLVSRVTSICKRLTSSRRSATSRRRVAFSLSRATSRAEAWGTVGSGTDGSLIVPVLLSAAEAAFCSAGGDGEGEGERSDILFVFGPRAAQGLL